MVAAAAAAAAAAADPAGTLVTTPLGKVQGYEANNTMVWRGIPVRPAAATAAAFAPGAAFALCAPPGRLPSAPLPRHAAGPTAG